MVVQGINIKAEIKSAIRAIDPFADVILFGSQARGEAGKYSDWDILVLTSKPIQNLKDQEPYRNAIFQIMMDTDEVISIIIRNKETWKSKHTQTPLFHEISEEGILL
jgi:predicted nucleotidyltransferase